MRLAHLLFMSGHQLFRHGVVDAEWHHVWARMISRGQLEAYAPFFRAPLYPWLLGLSYRLFGSGPWTGRLLSLLVSLVGVAAFHRLCLRWTGRQRALLISLAWALWGTAVFYSCELLITPLYTTLLILVMLCVARREYAGSALLLGLASIARPSALLLAPMLPLFHGRLPGLRELVAFLLPICVVFSFNALAGDPGTL
ncbi:glycosyltransferase family 39 protein, partial [Candidatus Fermentibacterales bacterium]|nr:glycosyltransferase family 39 protein [Candidatus Fermentibacterales bacterium]